MITYIEKQNIDKFAEAVNNLSLIVRNGTKVGVHILFVHFLLIKLILRNATYLKKIKRMTEECAPGKECELEKCKAQTLSVATQIRDDFNITEKKIMGIKYYSLIAPLLNEVTVAWDDFVIDLTISNDSELNNSLSFLSDAI
jgi:hypothetical protein